jgi:mannose-6-phosphate isomerase
MSAPLYPLLFQPRFKERVWGGRTLERLYRKPLPPRAAIGESWEVSDRPGDESVIANGPLQGKTLRWLMMHHGADVLGAAPPAAEGRFPLLCKILDAHDRLSLQVHPPARLSALGEPKTEMWYIAAAAPDAELYVGLKRGVTRADFEEAIRSGRVEHCFHRIPVRAGDAMFLPSGRVHAIGAGLVIFEIQQNSDTTFRVFDWNRLGLDGKPRDLHLAESLESIDFSDVEPALAAGDTKTAGPVAIRELVRHELFDVDLVEALDAGASIVDPPASVNGHPRATAPRIVGAVRRQVLVTGGGTSEIVREGRFALLPANLSDVTIEPEAGARYLSVKCGVTEGRA